MLEEKEKIEKDTVEPVQEDEEELAPLGPEMDESAEGQSEEDDLEQYLEEDTFHPEVPEAVNGGEDELQTNPEVQQEKMLTQSQVNELVGKARQEGRASAMRELLERYGVGGEDELNDVFGRGQAFDSLNDDYTMQSNLYSEVLAENALLKTNVDINRWEDVKLILGGKGLDVSEENIQSLLPSHPEWRNEAPVPAAVNGSGLEASAQQTIPNTNMQSVSTMRKLGEDVSPEKDEMSEEEQVKK